MTKPEVSIILPTYNRAHTLERAVASISSDDWSLEIVVVDDCSTDDTAELVDRLSRGGVPIVYLRHDTNRGVGHARQSGVAAASGRYLAWLDSDDEWLPGSLDWRMSELLADGTADVVSSTFHNRLEEGVGWPDWIPLDQRDRPSSAHTLTTMVSRREIFEKHPIDPALRNAGDTEWYIRARREGVRFTRIPRPGMNRWIGQDNLCHDRRAASSIVLSAVFGHARQRVRSR